MLAGAADQVIRWRDAAVDPKQPPRISGTYQDMNTRTVLRAFIISVLLALITTMTTSVLSATYLAQPMGAEPTVVTGFEAIRLWIDAAGIWGVLKSHVGWFLSVTVATFVACLIFLRWETRATAD